MKKGMIIVIIVLVALIAAGFYFFGGSNTEEEIPSGNYKIEIIGFAFAQQELKVKVGDTVSWVNKDSAKHTVTSDNGNQLDSELLSKGEIYSHTFNGIGVFEYHCTPHPYMTGRIIVE